MLCKLVRYIQMVALYSSSYVLLTTAIDRYIAICHPMRMHAWTQRRMHCLVVVAWSLSIALASPQLFIFAYDVDDRLGTFDCTIIIYFSWSRKAYVTFFAVAVYVVPLCVLVFLYLRICHAVWHRDSPSSRLRSSIYSMSALAVSSCSPKGGNTTRHSVPELRSCIGEVSPAMANGRSRLERRRERRLQRKSLAAVSGCSTTTQTHHPLKHGISVAKLKTVKLTSLVVGSYFVCQGPFFVSHAWAAWDNDAPFEGRTTWLRWGNYLAA